MRKHHTRFYALSGMAMIASACIIGTSLPASAFEGRYTNRNHFVQIDRRGETFSVTVDATRPGCIAEFQASGKIRDGKLIATDKLGRDVCELVVTPSGDGVSVQERGACQLFRGVSCTYNGPFRRAGAPRRATQ